MLILNLIICIILYHVIFITLGYYLNMECLNEEKKETCFVVPKIGHRWIPGENDFAGCPFCDSKEGWIEGPSGGMCTNFMCDNCGAKFNAMGPFGIELLGYPKYMDKVKESIKCLI